jgi:hypothetical protein
MIVCHPDPIFFFSFGTWTEGMITLCHEPLIDSNEVLGGTARGWGYGSL